MIAPHTGEIDFTDGLRITAHASIASLLDSRSAPVVVTQPLPVPGWRKHLLGPRVSSFGSFEVEVVTGAADRVEGVFLSHEHAFYRTASENDSERRVFHDGVIAADLFGQREFPWGHVFCRLDDQSNRDWLVVIYSPFSAVPLHEREGDRALTAYAPPPHS